MKKTKLVFTIIASLIFIILIYLIWYINDYYRASDDVYNYLRSSDNVVITLNNDTYFFDGYGNENAIVFYQGGKVENISYAPLLYKLAENGVDCFLVNMPFRLAILDKNKASSIIYNSKYDYNHWYLMGHSLGGAVASMYSNSHIDKVSGLILLAAYPTNNVDNNIKMLSIYDGVLNIKKYENNKKYWNNNSQEVIIDGGNHSNFGYYGFQSGDNKSSITREEQQEITIEKIIQFIDGGM